MIINDTTYLDIVADTLIVAAYAMAFEGQPPFSASLATTVLYPDGTGTRLVYTEQGAYLDGKDGPVKRESGCRAMFENLAKELTRSTATV